MVIIASQVLLVCDRYTIAFKRNTEEPAHNAGFFVDVKIDIV